jgi:hypothetical protein
MKKHPIQPLVDNHGTLRFKENAIVRHLLDHGGIDMNKLAMLPFENEDRVQFAQLIGYSLSGFGELSYVSDDDYDAAHFMRDGADEKDARIKALEDSLKGARERLKEVAALALDQDISDIDYLLDGKY